MRWVLYVFRTRNQLLSIWVLILYPQQRTSSVPVSVIPKFTAMRVTVTDDRNNKSIRWNMLADLHHSNWRIYDHHYAWIRIRWHCVVSGLWLRSIKVSPAKLRDRCNIALQPTNEAHGIDRHMYSYDTDISPTDRPRTKNKPETDSKSTKLNNTQSICALSLQYASKVWHHF